MRRALGPKAVDLVTVVADREPGVQARARDVLGIEEGDEALLEVAADAAAGVVAEVIERFAARLGAAVVRMAGEERGNETGAVDPEVFQLPERATRLPPRLFRRRGRGRRAAADVTGIPSTISRSSSGSIEKWRRIERVERTFRGTVTWISPVPDPQTP